MPPGYVDVARMGETGAAPGGGNGGPAKDAVKKPDEERAMYWKIGGYLAVWYSTSAIWYGAHLPATGLRGSASPHRCERVLRWSSNLGRGPVSAASTRPSSWRCTGQS